MAKIKITETNGASAKDISDAIGQFLDQLETKEDTIEEIEERHEKE